LKRYEVLVSETVLKQLRALKKEMRERMKKALLEMSADPFHARSKVDIIRLKGPKRDYYRLRVADYRAIYTVEGNKIMVVKILHRRSAYSWME